MRSVPFALANGTKALRRVDSLSHPLTRMVLTALRSDDYAKGD